MKRITDFAKIVWKSHKTDECSPQEVTTVNRGEDERLSVQSTTL